MAWAAPSLQPSPVSSRVLIQIVRACITIVLATVGAPAESAPPNLDYLSEKSASASAIFGEFIPVKDRFVNVAPGRTYDRFLNVTWIDVCSLVETNGFVGMDWESAHRLAAKLHARLPKLKELKTLITKRSTPETGVFIETLYFPLSSHTQKCWAADSAGPWKPYHRVYVDFAEPAWHTTSMSEIHCVFLISLE